MTKVSRSDKGNETVNTMSIDKDTCPFTLYRIVIYILSIQIVSPIEQNKYLHFEVIRISNVEITDNSEVIVELEDIRVIKSPFTIE